MDGAWRRPTDSSLCSGTPSLSEVPSGGARAFCLLLRFSKVSRRQGGTPSGRYLNNGYIPGPTVLTVRPPSRASPLPQVDRGVPGRWVPTIRPSSQASQLPHFQIAARQLEQRRLSGRHGQARRPQLTTQGSVNSVKGGSRRQGGTLSGRYLNNGYVPGPTVLTARPPSRASPLPQVDCGVSGREMSAGRPSSQASQLPHFLDRGASVRTASAIRPSRASPAPTVDRARFSQLSQRWELACLRKGHLDLKL